MDKKNTTIGVLLLLAAFALIYFAPRSAPPPPVARGQPSAPGAPGVPPTGLPGTHQSAQPPISAINEAYAEVSRESAEATITALGNDFIEARFTDSGGALKEVALKQYPAAIGSSAPFIFNELHADPILAFVEQAGLDRNTRFERVPSENPAEVIYRVVLNNQLEVTRTYTVAPNTGETTDPYQIRHETKFRNVGNQPSPKLPVSLSLGTAAPNNASDPALQLKTGFSTGSSQSFISRAELEPGSGFLGIGAHGSKPFISTPGPLAWMAVKNQFFTSILTADEPAMGLVTRRVKLFTSLPNESVSAYGLTGAAQFEVKSLEPGATINLAGNLYVGPKEYRRLANAKVFKADQDKIMDFGFFKYFSQILLTLMTWIHASVNNWGMAIILTTLFLKTIFIPFTLAASRSAKRMAKLQPELQAIREKFKDNPQKQQAATMELFKTRKINPVGGCLPILLTMPFFMGFFTMLPSAAELRFQPFLWANDLSAQDTVAVLFGIIPLNIMPLLMGATMVVQMHLTPSPSVDNMQMKMMKFMPYVFILICYTFSCALSLYSFVNGLFTIGQQLVINRMKEPEEPPAKPTNPGKPLKNVTPVVKKLKPGKSG